MAFGHALISKTSKQSKGRCMSYQSSGWILSVVTVFSVVAAFTALLSISAAILLVLLMAVVLLALQ